MQYKRCNDPDHEGPRYLPVTNFHKQGRTGAKQHYTSKCKVCRNRLNKVAYHQGKRPQWEIEKKRAYSRARSKALSRLALLTPELFGTLLQEELDKTDYDFSNRGTVYPTRY